SRPDREHRRTRLPRTTPRRGHGDAWVAPRLLRRCAHRAHQSDPHHRITEQTVLSRFTPVRPTWILEGNTDRRRWMIFVSDTARARPAQTIGCEGPATGYASAVSMRPAASVTTRR